MCCTYMHVIGEKIGEEPTLPYLSPELDGEKLLAGANFASAGIGILNDTGIQFVSSIFFLSKVAFYFRLCLGWVKHLLKSKTNFKVKF